MVTARIGGGGLANQFRIHSPQPTSKLKQNQVHAPLDRELTNNQLRAAPHWLVVQKTMVDYLWEVVDYLWMR